MADDDIINEDEEIKLTSYIKSHRPKEGEKHYDSSQKYSLWYWEDNKWPPRQAWLEDQIKKYSR